jgi:2-methylcitrate dehydratase PrpD
VFDTVCAVRVGALLPDGRALETAERLLGAGFLGRLVTAVGACRATEMDDIHPGACVTAGSVVVPTALVLGSGWAADDVTVLLAIVAGYETAVHVGNAIGGPAAVARETWPTHLAAPLAAAAVAARLRGCDATTTRSALALAAMRSRAQLAPDEPERPARWLAIGLAAADGVTAVAGAIAAIRPAAVTSDLQGLDSELRHAALGGCAPGAIAQVETKPFATARQALSPLHALLTLLARRPAGSTPTAVRLGVPPEFEEMLGARAGDRWSSLSDLRTQAALAIADRERLWDPLRAGRWNTESMRALAARIGIERDPALTALLPGRWAGRAAVTWADGARDERLVTDPPGSIAQPLDWDGLRDKWARTLASMRVTPDWTGHVMDLCRATAGTPGQASARALAEILDPAIDDDKERLAMTAAATAAEDRR